MYTFLNACTYIGLGTIAFAIVFVITSRIGLFKEHVIMRSLLSASIGAVIIFLTTIFIDVPKQSEPRDPKFLVGTMITVMPTKSEAINIRDEQGREWFVRDPNPNGTPSGMYSVVRINDQIAFVHSANNERSTTSSTPLYP